MQRKHFFLPQEQLDWIKQASVGGGIPQSEVVRRVIDKHIAELEPISASSQSKRKEENG